MNETGKLKITKVNETEKLKRAAAGVGALLRISGGIMDKLVEQKKWRFDKKFLHETE